MAQAETYPTRPITLIVPFAAGGPTDVIGRILGAHIQTTLGQTVVIENVTGASGTLAGLRAARATPDGYTLTIGHWGTHVINGAIYQLQYDVLRDFEPVALLANGPQLIIGRPTLPPRDLKELIAWLKDNKATAGTAGPGTGAHVAAVFFQSLTGTSFSFVPYRGAGPALNDTVAGQVPIIFDNMPSALPFIKDGRLIAIVVAAPQRLAQLPSVPTFKEVGLEPVNRMAYYGIYGPKGLPRDIVEKVHGAVRKTLDDPNVKKRIEETGSLIIGNTPEQFGAQIAAEFEVYKKVVALQKLTLE